MRFDVLTLFPAMVDEPLKHSVIGRARKGGILDIQVHNLRDWALGRHKVTDDVPYGGGAGMVLKVEPIFSALEALKKEGPPAKVILMGPGGTKFTQGTSHRLASEKRLILLCGHYEGIDDRVRHYVDEEISLGDFILTGGEMAALAVIDSVGRMVPGVVGNQASLIEESFETGLLDHPHYTRPRAFNGQDVPDVLLSGHHDNIRKWRRAQALRRTQQLRPDLLEQFELSKEDRRLLSTLGEGKLI